MTQGCCFDGFAGTIMPGSSTASLSLGWHRALADASRTRGQMVVDARATLQTRSNYFHQGGAETQTFSRRPVPRDQGEGCTRSGLVKDSRTLVAAASRGCSGDAQPRCPKGHEVDGVGRLHQHGQGVWSNVWQSVRCVSDTAVGQGVAAHALQIGAGRYCAHDRLSCFSWLGP